MSAESTTKSQDLDERRWRQNWSDTARSWRSQKGNNWRRTHSPMTSEPLERYRNWYATLLRLYPKPYRERFGEGMEQTFNDLLHERRNSGQGLSLFVLWMFAETLAGILRENERSIVMQNNKSLIRIALVTGCILLVPLLGNLFMGWNWPPFAFPLWGALLFGTGLTYELVARKGSTTAYRFAVGIACTTGFVLV